MTMHAFFLLSLTADVGKVLQILVVMPPPSDGQ